MDWGTDQIIQADDIIPTAGYDYGAVAVFLYAP